MAVKPYTKDPKDVGRDIKTEMAALVVALAVFIVLMFLGSYMFGALWLLAAIFAFGIWRIGKADLK